MDGILVRMKALEIHLGQAYTYSSPVDIEYMGKYETFGA